MALTQRRNENIIIHLSINILINRLDQSSILRLLSINVIKIYKYRCVVASLREKENYIGVKITMKKYVFGLTLILVLGQIITGCSQKTNDEAIVLKTGLHLFIDDYLVAEKSFLSRTVNNPEKLPEPIISGKKGGDDNFQPYMSVLRDDKTDRFRMWYNTPEHKSQSHIGYLESEDGINWIRPHRVLKDPHKIKFGVTVLDQGMVNTDPAKRYVLATYMTDGMMISTSADGFDWKPIKPEAPLKHNHDISSMHWDPIREHYLAIVSVWKRNDEWNDNQRTPHQSVSKDLMKWEEPWPIMTGKIGAPIEKGETQFYAMSGVITRGDLLIGLVKILRDDINATPGKTGKQMGDMNRKAAGLGYTVLAWSRDGRTWQRDHQPFLDRNMIPGTWDHAHVWGDEQIIVDDKTYVYYGGYAHGHKVDRFNERQIGLAIMPRDRYVAYEASIVPGKLISKPVSIQGKTMTVNAKVVGNMRMRLIESDGSPLSGFGWIDVKGDDVDIPVNWKGDFASLQGQTICLEIELQNAQIFGFDLQN